LDLLAGLDLGAAVVAGEWAWMDGRKGDTLELPLTGDHRTRQLRLPLRARDRSYNFVFELWLDEPGADAAVVLSVGATRVALMLNYSGTSGLDLVRGVQWKGNEPPLGRPLPLQRFFTVEVRVRSQAESVHINVRIDGAPFIDWQGPQRDLSLENGLFESDSASEDEPLTLATFAGGLRIRKLLARLLP